MRALAKLSPLEIWHSRIELWTEIRQIENRSLRQRLHAILTKAGKRLGQDDNFPHLVKGREVRIVDKPPLIYHFTRKRDARHRVNAERMFASYQKRLTPERLYLFDRYSLNDMAFKAVGFRRPNRAERLISVMTSFHDWRVRGLVPRLL